MSDATGRTLGTCLQMIDEKVRKSPARWGYCHSSCLGRFSKVKRCYPTTTLWAV